MLQMLVYKHFSLSDIIINCNEIFNKFDIITITIDRYANMMKYEDLTFRVELIIL